MSLLPDTQYSGLRMRRECRECFPCHQLQRKPLVSDPDMHYGTCVMNVPWCMSVSLTRGGGERVPGILGACATRNFAYLVRGPCHDIAYYVTMTNVGYTEIRAPSQYKDLFPGYRNSHYIDNTVVTVFIRWISLFFFVIADKQRHVYQTIKHTFKNNIKQVYIRRCI